MNGRRHLWILLLGLLLGGQARAQYSDYNWALALHKEYGFDDMAEQVLKAMVDGPNRSPLDKQQGRLGLAELKAAFARKAPDLDTRLADYKSAAKLIQEVVKGWKDKRSKAYFQAIFSLVNVLQKRGEAALDAIKSGRLGDEQRASYSKSARGDFLRAEVQLNTIKSRFSQATLKDDPQGWRLKYKAWYMICLLTYQKALVMKSSVSRGLALGAAKDKLEDYVLNVDTGEPEATLGALYGYLLLGRVADARGEGEEALGNWLSILDQIVWTQKLVPAVQSLEEQTHWELLKHFNKEQQYEKALDQGRKMESHYADLKMTWGIYGRAARVELAKALFKLGKVNEALGIVSGVAQEGKNDASARMANRLVAEIIAATPDKTGFSPSVIESAAKGAWSQGSSGREEAVGYYKILLQVVGKIKNKEERDAVAAQAWYRLAYDAYDRGDLLRAALICRQGALHCAHVSVTGPRLVRYWHGWLRKFESATGSKEVQKLVTQCRDWQIKNSDLIGKGGVTKSKGDLLYQEGRELEDEAKQAAGKREFSKSRSLYKRAAAKYDSSAREGGRNQELARSKRARCGLKAAKLFVKEKDIVHALPLLESSKKQFRDYLAYAANPANASTDPAVLASRKTARAEARYSIAEANEYLLKITKDKERIAALNTETVAALKDYEKTFADQKNLSMFALKSRFKAQVALGRVQDALQTYRTMVKVSATLKEGDRLRSFTSWAGARIARIIRKPILKRWKKLVGKARPSDGEVWKRVAAKPGFEALREDLNKANELYREWLMSRPERKREAANWFAVGGYFFDTATFKPAAEILGYAIDHFEGSSKTDPKRLMWARFKLLVAAEKLAKAAESDHQADTALRWWNESDQLATELLAMKRKLRYDQVLRLAAVAAGGYVERRPGGIYKYIPATGKYKKAHDLWMTIYTREKALHEGESSFYEAYFNLLHVTWRLNKTAGQGSTGVRKSLTALKASTQEDLGGPKWKPFFEWLERQVT